MLRKQGVDSQNAGSFNDYSRNQGFSAPFEESGSDIGSCISDLSNDDCDVDMDDLSRCQEA